MEQHWPTERQQHALTSCLGAAVSASEAVRVMGISCGIAGGSGEMGRRGGVEGRQPCCCRSMTLSSCIGVWREDGMGECTYTAALGEAMPHSRELVC